MVIDQHVTTSEAVGEHFHGHVIVRLGKANALDGCFSCSCQVKGLLCLKAQAAKIFGNKKGKLVCKDTAQALWSSSMLATMSVSGNVAPKKRALGELPKQQLTPEKVNVVAATVQHRGRDTDVSEVLQNVPKLLTERIQNAAKAMKKIESNKAL
ncbi:hypothetical protein HPB50_001657 [Hyalomma asiaticum]|uniref:Uncharacterized protein n=1 Tax=Hyalomma asiaticum TaxID=266040 RepID=A0ACB7RRG5_HYAAI|nr:hypothetical protein HPB50_001657 [Hyalomma asiaticum]